MRFQFVFRRPLERVRFDEETDHPGVKHLVTRLVEQSAVLPLRRERRVNGDHAESAEGKGDAVDAAVRDAQDEESATFREVKGVEEAVFADEGIHGFRNAVEHSLVSTPQTFVLISKR